jgi:uncharacterized GH25 family protein
VIEKSSKGSLFLKFNAEKDGLYVIAVEYGRGIYSVIEGNKWMFGEKDYIAGFGYAIKESRWICGFAKTYAIVGNHYDGKLAAGLELEIVPEAIRDFRSGEKLKVQLFFRGNPVKGEINVRVNGKHSVIKTDNNGFSEIELAKGVNVISARYVDDMAKIAGICDRRNITTTLTIVAE